MLLFVPVWPRLWRCSCMRLRRAGSSLGTWWMLVNSHCVERRALALVRESLPLLGDNTFTNFHTHPQPLCFTHRVRSYPWEGRPLGRASMVVHLGQQEAECGRDYEGSLAKVWQELFHKVRNSTSFNCFFLRKSLMKVSFLVSFVAPCGGRRGNCSTQNIKLFSCHLFHFNSPLCRYMQDSCRWLKSLKMRCFQG